jgi:hypothetical protein
MCSNAFGKIRGLANVKTKVESASYVGDKVKILTLGVTFLGVERIDCVSI